MKALVNMASMQLQQLPPTLSLLRPLSSRFPVVGKVKDHCSRYHRKSVPPTLRQVERLVCRRERFNQDLLLGIISVLIQSSQVPMEAQGDCQWLP